MLAYIAGRYQYAFNSGETVLLKTAPVDPRDLLRGDYVILSYDISALDASKLRGDAGRITEKDTVYVRLEKDNKFWAAREISTTRPADQNVWIKGVLIRARNNNLDINYGIEQFFVPEGTGRDIEGQPRANEISVEVKVTKQGLGLISQVFINDQPVDFKPQR